MTTNNIEISGGTDVETTPIETVARDISSVETSAESAEHFGAESAGQFEAENVNKTVSVEDQKPIMASSIEQHEFAGEDDHLGELTLGDSFLEHKEIETKDVPQKAESSHLPNVLVDQQLMEEIASIPDRFGFKIGDVADLLGIKQYVLRYWEQEFDLLKPKKASNNQRLYTKKDVENAFLIRKLLYRDKFSIEGARQALKDVKFAVKKEKDFNSVIQKIDFVQDQIKNFVEEIKRTKNLFN